MGKTSRHFLIDNDIDELLKIRRFKDPDFSSSELINGFLRDFFSNDLGNLEKNKLEMRKAEITKELALIKAQEKALDTEKDRVQRKKNKEMYGTETPKVILSITDNGVKK